MSAAAKTRVCLVRMSALGDVVQCVGAVTAFAEAQPDVELHFVTQTTFAPLLIGLPLQSVIAHPRRGGIQGLGRTTRAMRALHFDVCVDLQGNWKSALIARLSGAKIRIGASGEHRQEPLSAMLLNRRIPIVGVRHPGVVAEALLTEIGVSPPGTLPPRDPRLVVREGEIDAAADAVRAAGIDPSEPFTVFVFTDPSDNRSWRLPGMLRQVSLESGPVLWLRGPSECEVPLPDGVRSISHVPGQIRDLIGLGYLLARVGGRVCGPDQGATHVLAACGVETLAFYGPQDPERTAPPAARILVAVDGPDCMPCRSRSCSNPAGPVCMAFDENQARELPRDPRKPEASEL